ncbi:hypothetical protein NCC49_002779 [Naganishia albida]|nr:hypothetical protein NCC49_002779 [Naganishia albida]
MLVPPPQAQRSQSTPQVLSSSFSDNDLDDEGWQDMPVVRSEESQAEYGYEVVDPRQNKYRAALIPEPESRAKAAGNATGTAIHLDADSPTKTRTETANWREKLTEDEGDYTRLRLMEDEESEEVHMRTKYLFDEDKAMTPLSQMQATKELLTEGQRIAYVGLCALVARGMIRDMGRGWVMGKKEKARAKGVPAEPEVVESGRMWMLKIMAKLYQHMDLSPDEQRMIESLAEHGVTPDDLAPALMTTHTIENPEYDEAEAKRQEEGGRIEGEDEKLSAEEKIRDGADTALEVDAIEARFAEASRLDDRTQNHEPPAPPYRESADEAEADIADLVGSVTLSAGSGAATPRAEEPQAQTAPVERTVPPPREEEKPENPLAMGKALPGVSTTLSKTDRNVTLDIRWTVLCDLFLQLIGDSVYDSRSRVFLERVAEKLELTWMDVTRFEKRVTDSLEIQEGVERLEQDGIIEDRMQKGKKKRYAMMGLATLGGGLVIGLSAGLAAPLIGAGLGAAFATVGVTGATGFLAGAGGAAVITTGGVLTGGRIAGRGMARRTRNVGTFEFKPIHNNKRVNCFITVPGFMASPADDVRLPFSTLDPTVGDVFSVLWEPEMMNEMGNALKILTSEVLTQVGQTVLQATAMTALMSALQWPLILTKLGYLIDNPWSNALDRSWHAGQVLADVLISRHAGVRPISLIGFSLGARAIFYALEELAKRKAYGIVQDVYLFGATVTAPAATWLNVRSAIAGRFVNAFATSDWLLGYLFRFTSGGLNTVAGLRPVEGVPGLDNVDVTDKVAGHLSYRSCMPALLEVVGLPITADWFDEPDDPDFENLEEGSVEDETAEKKKDSKGVWRIFKKGKGTESGKSAPQTGVTPPPSYNTHATSNDKVEEYDDDSGDITSTHVTGELGKRLEKDEPETPQDLPKTAGFDFKAIGEVLGKNVDPETVKLAEPKVHAPLPTPLSRLPAPLERSESAPPLSDELERGITPLPSSLRPSETTRNTPFQEDTEDLTAVVTEVPVKPAKQFPSHVLKSAASIFSANPFATTTPVMQDTEVWESDRVASPASEREDEADIGYQFEAPASRDLHVGGFGEGDLSSSGWGKEVDKPKSKDDWALNNPW